MKETIPPDYFERMFASDPDPWNFETSLYEAHKFDRSIEAMGGRHFARVLEVGCANGVLTRRIASHCDSLLSLDVSDTALSRARRRNLDIPHVKFAQMTFPQETPEGQFDLIVLSEVVYYWSETDIKAAGDWIASHLSQDGNVLLVHWIGETDYPQTGDNAVNLLHAAIKTVEVVETDKTEAYRLDLWRIG